ncbi:hypothetical protein [Clostridium akagii]|uniref:hypothetical protein n=1 Tax=Clostridium akagii TaxID=91623 RepID=UPI00047870C9|nr:hypothetical protein [Clostridium akagii]
MIRKILEEDGIKLTDKEFKKVMKAATQDIKFNRIGFKKKTDSNEMIDIVKICCVVRERSEE